MLREIKQQFPSLPVNDGDRLWRRPAATPRSELGAAEFITKPVDFDLLNEQLRQLPAGP